MKIETIKELESEGIWQRHMIEESKEKGFINAVKYIKIQTLKHIVKLINEDIEYQKTKLTGEFDKPIKWRIIGMELLKSQIEGTSVFAPKEKQEWKIFGVQIAIRKDCILIINLGVDQRKQMI